MTLLARIAHGVHFADLRLLLTRSNPARRGEQLRMLAALRESNERFMLAAHGARDGLWDWNLRTGELYLSTRWKSMLGYQDAELPSSLEGWFARVAPQDLPLLRDRLDAYLAGQAGELECEYRVLHRDGEYRWMLLRAMALRDRRGLPSRIAGSQTDITERRTHEQHLRHAAQHDALTGLPNRTLFRERLTQELARNPSPQLAVLVLNLDRFKLVNEGFGQQAGDELLRLVSLRLRASLRAHDTLARLDGDEFAVLLNVEEQAPLDYAERVAELLQDSLAEPFDVSGHQITVSASIGVVLGARGGEQPDALLRGADAAVTRAKRLGRGRHVLLSPELQLEDAARLQLEADLRHAVERHELHLEYQPIVSLATEHVIGFEALVRWQHPQLGLLTPDRFIPIAEDSGLILPIGWWVLQEACRQLCEWQQLGLIAYPLTMSVNLSPLQLAEPNLAPLVERMLHEAGLDGHTLKLEVTESALMHDLNATAAHLRSLRELGIELLIDDFGTGYSSLSALHDLPIDSLKVDRSFVSGLVDERGKQEIVRTIVGLATTLNLKVIAEGIETPDQLSALRALGCDYGQGYLFARPLHSSRVPALFAAAPYGDIPLHAD